MSDMKKEEYVKKCQIMTDGELINFRDALNEEINDRWSKGIKDEEMNFD